jgi:tRNA pseudouridine55 synthase
MGIFVVDKPLGLTSHDVVSRARKQLHTRRVGHAGTLDPLATGVLVVLSDAATKLSPFLTASHKDYLAWVSFGASTATLDAEPPVLARADASSLTSDDIQGALEPFLELRDQVPPQYSAIKKAGKRSYDAARAGEQVLLEPRPVRYFETRFLAWNTRSALPRYLQYHPDGQQEHWQVLVDDTEENAVATANDNADVMTLDTSTHLPEPLADLPTALIWVRVQAGTYIRALARDLGDALGVPAHLSGLVRTRAGHSHLHQACAVSDLAAQTSLRARDMLSYPQQILSDEDTQRIRQGQRLPLHLAQRTAFIDQDGHLVAVAETEPDSGRMSLLRVWHETL